MLKSRLNNYRNSESGSALVYILIAIALLAALTVSFMEPSSQQTQSQGTFKTVSEVTSQVEFVRSSIQECLLTYPQGDQNAMTSGAQDNNPYPLMPNNIYFDDQCGSGESTNESLVKHLRCPGNPGNDEPCHISLFGGSANKFMPPSPSLFGEWKYYNGADGVFFWIETTKSDAFLENALNKIEQNYAKCEADVIIADSTYTMASDNSSVVCPGGAKCLRVWLKINSTTGSPQYQEAGCPS